MLKFSALFVLLNIFLIPLTSLGSDDAATIKCPDLSQNEKAEDCPWAGLARELALPLKQKPQKQDAQTTVNKLESLAPTLVSKLRLDARVTSWHELWGQSINYDELAKGQIVEAPILEAIAKKMGIPFSMNHPQHVVHAGMEHTYGYLFSTLKTPFGYKRARWVQGELDRGFNLPVGIFGPTPSEGTLFANVSFFIGNIAFRFDPEKLEILKKALGQRKTELASQHDKSNVYMLSTYNVAKPVLDFDFSKLKITRILEDVLVPNTTQHILIRTDLVPFLIKDPLKGSKNSNLLIYSVVDPRAGGAKLITAFPVEDAFVAKITDEKLMGQKPVMTRYNGFVEGVTGAKLIGSRSVIR